MEIVEQDEQRSTLRCSAEQTVDSLEKPEALAFGVDHCSAVEFRNAGSQLRHKTRHLRREVAVAHLLRKFCIRESVQQLRQGFDKGLVRRQRFLITMADESRRC